MMYRILTFLSLIGCLPALAQDTPATTPLEEVVVHEHATHGESTAIKLDIHEHDLPVSVESVDPELLDQAQAWSLEALLDNASLASAATNEGGLNAALILRGFTDTAVYRNGMNDSRGPVPLRDLANIESVEIIKGAGSALFGPGEPGGTVNFITRQPEFTPGYRGRLSAGSESYYRVELDATGPITEDVLAYRAIAAWEGADSFRDFVDHDRVFVAPSLLWQPGDHWQVLAELEYLRHETLNDTGVIVVDGAFPLPHDRYLGEPRGHTAELDALTFSLGVEHQLDNGMLWDTTLLYQDTAIDSHEVEAVELLDPGPGGERLLLRELLDETDAADVLALQTELSGDWDWTGITHRLLGGYEYATTDTRVRFAASDSDDDPFAIDIHNPVYGQDLPPTTLLQDIDETLNLHSLYLQDFIEIGPYWKLLLGTRLDHVDIDVVDRAIGLRFNQTDTEFSHRAGLLYAPSASVGVFISYNESMEPNEGVTAAGTALQPTQAESWEVGIKLHHPDEILTLDLAAYRIEQTDVTTEDPVNPGFEIQTARQISKGIDLDLIYNPVHWLQTGIKYAWTDAQIRDDTEVPDGTRPLNVPRHKLVLSGMATFSLRHEDDFSAGIHVVYKSDQAASLDVDELDIRLPGYWTTSLFMDYQFSPRVALGLNVINLFDEDYLAGSQANALHITPGKPLTVIGSIAVSF